MSPDLLELLACPQCGGRPAEDGKALRCEQCGTVYPVVRGVPRLVPPDLSQLEERTARAFGWQWRHYVEMHPEYRDEFLDWVHPLQPEDFAGRVVLDAGCGIGRHAYFAAAFGARTVVGMDLSDAVETAREVLADAPAAHVVQGDLTRPPLRSGGEAPFDLVYSIGVVHHLPDPAAGVRALARVVKPGGTLLVWVYGYEGNAFARRVLEPARRVTTRLPHRLLRAVAFPLAVVLHAVVKLVYGPFGATRVGRRLPMSAYLRRLSEFTFRHNEVIVYDQLVAPSSRYVKREELEQWLRDAGLEDVSVTARNENSWRGLGRRPAAAEGTPP